MATMIGSEIYTILDAKSQLQDLISLYGRKKHLVHQDCSKKGGKKKGGWSSEIKSTG